MPPRLGSLALALVLALPLLGQASEGAAAAGAARRIGPGPIHKALLRNDDPEAARVRASGTVAAAFDYGALTFFHLDERRAASREAFLAADLPFDDVHDVVALDGRPVDGSRPASSPIDPAAGLYVVQFAAPVRDAWLEALDALGVGFRQPVPHHALIVACPPERAVLLPALREVLPFVQYVGPYEPLDKIAPDLRAAALRADAEPVGLVVQLVGDAAATGLAYLRDHVGGVGHAWEVGAYVDVRVDARAADVLAIAARPEVFAVERRGILRRRDEAQGQILAGRVNATGPIGPGYLAWLASQGFDGSQFRSFAVNVVDDAPSLTGHPDLPPSRVAFEHDPTAQGPSQAGHGFLNAHIIAGFNNGAGAAFEDAAGFNYGLGIAPWANVGATAIFGGAAADATAWEGAAYRASARISSNSWGYTSGGGGPLARYDSAAQEFDLLVRDAQKSVAGRQELVVVFAAGNDGAGANTVSSPATAKNVLTLGASENFRPTGTDGCGIKASGADDVDDLIAFSSRGPVNAAGGDGRVKPDLVAPGTHVQAGVPQSNYVGGGTCDQYWPAGQTLYGWSSGTSHSTPAAAGAAALLRQRALNAGKAPPSPAMTKAWLMNAATYMVGVGAGGSLPSNAQGMGRLDLGRALDGALRLDVDQSQVLGAAGASHALSGVVADPTRPVRVTLAWSDAPGPTTGAPWVNDLDLVVTVGGVAYKGNVFSGASSVAGGAADGRNNVESVFLPVGASGPVVITVVAAAIAGDGVPGNADKTDQDFALTAYNVAAAAVPPVADFAVSAVFGVAPLTVQFSDLSTGTATAWAWSFGDGTTSSQRNPSKTYATPGTYTVSLTASGPAGSDAETKAGYVVVTAAPKLYVSFTATTTLPGLGAVDDEDVVAYDPATSTWSMVFDGGDVGLAAADVRGAARLPGGDWVFTFSATTTVPGLTGGPAGTTVTSRQAVRFTPTSLGTTTAGSFAFYFDGEDVGLTSSTEALDGFTIGANGRIYVSTSGTPTVPGLTGLADEDVLEFTPTTLGATTAGTWALKFDGSDVGFGDAADEDLDAIAFDAAGRLLFSTTGAFAVPGAAGADEDVGRFAGTFGPATSGASTLAFDLSAFGVAAGADVDGLWFDG